MKRSPFFRRIAFAGILLTIVPSRAEVPQALSYQGRVSVNGTNFSGTGQFKFALVDAGQNQNLTATANAFATLMVTSITVASGGSGYVDAPLVTISPPDDPEGVQATATATIEGGIVTGITITAAGSGYFNHPQVTIAPPPPNVVHQIYWSNAGDLAPGEVPATSVSLPVVNGLYSVRLGDTSLPNMAAFSIPEIFYTPLYVRVWFDDGIHGLQKLSPDQPLSSAPYAMQARLAESVPPGSISSGQLANGAVNSFKLADGAVSGAKLSDASISPAKLISAAAPTAGQVLRFDGTQFSWANPDWTLPYSGSASTGGAVLSLQNNSNGASIEATGTSGDGLRAITGGDGKSAVFGQSNSPASGQGVYGFGLFGATGVLGVSSTGDGVSGRTNGIGRTGVFGYAEGANSSGLHGRSSLHHGVYAHTGSADRAAIWAEAPNGAEAIHGHSDGGDAVVGYTAASTKAGVFGFTNSGNGVAGYTPATGKAGIYGWSDNITGYGGIFSNPTNTAIKAFGHVDVDGAVIATGNILCERQIRSDRGCLLRFEGPAIFQVASSTSCYTDLTVHGNINHHGAIHNLSDARLKNIDGDYTRGLQEVSGIHTIRYTFKPSDTMPVAGEPRVGVTAQELREVIPEAVMERADGKLMMSTEPVFWAMVNSIKELKAENDALRARLDAIEAKLK